MEMQQPTQPADGGADPKALLEQAQALIGKALQAMGAEESAEGDPAQTQRADIARQVFGGGQG